MLLPSMEREKRKSLNEATVGSGTLGRESTGEEISSGYQGGSRSRCKPRGKYLEVGRNEHGNALVEKASNSRVCRFWSYRKALGATSFKFSHPVGVKAGRLRWRQGARGSILVEQGRLTRRGASPAHVD